MCLNPNNVEILAKILMAFILRSSLSFFILFDVKSAVIDSGPDIALAYNFTKSGGHKFNDRNISAPEFIESFDKLANLFDATWSDTPINFDNSSRLDVINSLGRRPSLHLTSKFLFRSLNLIDLILLQISFSSKLEVVTIFTNLEHNLIMSSSYQYCLEWKSLAKTM